MALSLLRRNSGSNRSSSNGRSPSNALTIPDRDHREEHDLQPWGTLAELERFNRQLSAYLDDWRHGLSGVAAVADAFTPLADVEETDEAYLVEIELPGVKQDDVDVEISGRRLSVRGERKAKERVGILRRRDRVVGRFSYEITLPGSVVEEQVSADLVEGVLTVRVPKPAEERPRRIPIS